MRVVGQSIAHRALEEVIGVDWFRYKAHCDQGGEGEEEQCALTLPYPAWDGEGNDEIVPYTQRPLLFEVSLVCAEHVGESHRFSSCVHPCLLFQHWQHQPRCFAYSRPLLHQSGPLLAKVGNKSWGG